MEKLEVIFKFKQNWIGYKALNDHGDCYNQHQVIGLKDKVVKSLPITIERKGARDNLGKWIIKDGRKVVRDSFTRRKALLL